MLRAFAALAAALATVFSVHAFAPATARASHNQWAILQDDLNLLNDPATTVAEFRHLGVSMVRILVRWSAIAPDPRSHQTPQFNATDPNAYPSANWAPIDAAVLALRAAGIQVMLDPTAFAPLWAQGPDPQRYGGKYDVNFAWEPNAREWGQFVQAVGERYSGSFTPSGASTPLPHISYWEIYNEPNFGEDLAPQALDGSTLMQSPKMYRSIVDNAWSALQGTGHSQDTIILGSLLADGYQAGRSRKAPQGLPGTYGDMMPLVFVRELYCLKPNYHRYTGWAAYVRGCPTTRGGYASFRSKHPALFQAGAWSDHPYDLPKELPPNQAAYNNPSWAEFAQIPHFASVLDYIQRLYGSGKQVHVWNTEYGYITCPPNCSWRSATPKTAAYYINWAEYLSWRDPNLASTMQYLLYDPNPTVGVAEHGGFSSGLVFFGGPPKPEYYAYRMPIFLPYTRVRRGRRLELWGGVRPAPFAVADGDGPQSVQVQFARLGHPWTTLATLPVTDPRGYIDSWMTFPGSGWVRLAWTYPSHDNLLRSYMVTDSNGTIYSRQVRVTVTR